MLRPRNEHQAESYLRALEILVGSRWTTPEFAAEHLLPKPLKVTVTTVDGKKPDDDFRVVGPKAAVDLRRNLGHYRAPIWELAPVAIGDEIRIDLFDGWPGAAVAHPWKATVDYYDGWPKTTATGGMHWNKASSQPLPSPIPPGYFNLPHKIADYYLMGSFRVPLPPPFGRLPNWLERAQ